MTTFTLSPGQKNNLTTKLMGKNYAIRQNIQAEGGENHD